MTPSAITLTGSSYEEHRSPYLQLLVIRTQRLILYSSIMSNIGVSHTMFPSGEWPVVSVSIYWTRVIEATEEVRN